MYKFLDFSKFSYLVKLIYSTSKSLKQANFCRSLQNPRAEIQLLANILAALHCDKTMQDRESYFLQLGSLFQVLQNINSQYPLKNILILTIAQLKSLFIFFCKCAKNAKNIKQIKIKARQEISTIKLVLKSLDTLSQSREIRYTVYKGE